jgi:DNA-binding NarL/FixJ family response regulator
MERAEEAFQRGDWLTAYEAWSADADQLSAAELDRLATAADLLGKYDVTVDALQRAFVTSHHQGAVAFAVHCAFRLAMTTAEHSEPALAAGWAARADRLAGDLPEDALERGWVAVLRMFQQLADGRYAQAAACVDEAIAIGRRQHDPDLEVIAMCSQGRLRLYSGQVREGLALLDEAMVRVIAGEAASPIIAGHVYCTAIEGCQEIGDFDRVAQWTAALERWCDRQSGLLTFTGQCALHRGQLLRLSGAWGGALEEFDRAAQRYFQLGATDAVGLTAYEAGDILRLRGEFDAAEAAYRRAADHGFDPQPGLALLWLVQGRSAHTGSAHTGSGAALAEIERLLAEQSGVVQRCRLLPAAIEVLLGCEQTSRARELATELASLVVTIGTGALEATASYAQGMVELASGDPAGGLPYLRKARQFWARAGAPHELARTRAAMGRALLQLGADESARRELDAAALAFRDLRARPEAAAVTALLVPDAAPGGLTAREVEVLRLVASGHSNAQIAADLVLSEKTVARHLSNIFTKLDVGSRAAATAYAFEHGVVRHHLG